MQGLITLTLFLSLLSVNPQSRGSGIPKTKNKKTDMKKLIMKLLGLESLVTEVASLRKENEELKAYQKDLTMAQEGLRASLDELTEQVEEIESPDLDEYVREDDVNDRIESYINDNDIVSQSYVDDEIESKVSDAVESAIDDLDIEDKVKEVVADMDKASFGDTEEIEQAVSKAVAEVLSKAYNALKKGL